MVMKTQNLTDQFSNLTQELRRGVLPLAVLSMLRENKYGYALINDLEQFGIEIDQGTLYPMLRRLETQGLLQSTWIIEGSRPRRYYKISAVGSQVLETLSTDWKNLNLLMVNLLGNVPNTNGGRNETD
jgi:PadR family transcriptional regulator PadR